MPPCAVRLSSVPGACISDRRQSAGRRSVLCRTGLTYCLLLEKLAKEDPPAFICHYYNFYFAHTAGGRMIGNKVRA